MNDPSKFRLEKLINIILQFKIPMAFDVLNSKDKEEAGEPYLVIINNSSFAPLKGVYIG